MCTLTLHYIQIQINNYIVQSWQSVNMLNQSYWCQSFIHAIRLTVCTMRSNFKYISMNVCSSGNIEQSNNGGHLSNPMNKVNSSEFDPLQDKKHNSSDVVKDSNSTPPSNVTGHPENVEGRPQSVPNQTQSVPPIVSSASNSILTFGRIPTTGKR